MMTALLFVVFVGLCGLVVWTLDYVPDDRIADTAERRSMQIAAERHDRHR